MSIPSTNNPKHINLDKKKKEKQRLNTQARGILLFCAHDFQIRDQFTTIYIPEMCVQPMHGNYRSNAHNPINKSLIVKSAAALCTHSHTFPSFILGACLYFEESKGHGGISAVHIASRYA